MVLVGAPMDAAAFAPAADLLAVDHTVLTTDPRGIHRSPLDDPEQDSTPAGRADDLAALLTHLGAGPGAVLGSRGGAVTALDLAQAHPGLVHTVVAHEPPLEELLDDRDELRAHADAMVERYRAGDALGAWQLFLDAAGLPVPAELMVAREPLDAADQRRWFLHEMRLSTAWGEVRGPGVRPHLAGARRAAARRRTRAAPRRAHRFHRGPERVRPRLRKVLAG